MAQLIYALKNVNIQIISVSKKKKKTRQNVERYKQKLNIDTSCDLTGNFSDCFGKIFTSAGFPLVSRPKYADKCTQTNDSDFDFTRYYGPAGVNRGLPGGLKMLDRT